MALYLVLGALALAQGPAVSPAGRPADVPPAVRSARRFLAHRGPAPGRRLAFHPVTRPNLAPAPAGRQSSAPAANWEPLGPAAVLTSAYGLVSGRVSSLALDPSDSTGNTLYAGTTGGGLWVSHNAATSDVSNITFTPLTDRLAAMSSAEDASISIGAVSIQPGGTGVILAGTGDPNDALDSYYGAGLLRSTDGGATWSLITGSSDVINGGAADYGFLGEGFAGFAWSTANPQLVVAAVSQSYDSWLVAAGLPNYSYSGLYYSTDSGATWRLSRITDGNGMDVQGPLDAFAGADGNAATAVVWNPVRNLFVAAVRFHGYYQSADGVIWTRLASQPGAGLTAAMCPTNPTSTGSPACPIFRGALAVNPLTGDTFAWTVDENNRDQGLWQDSCGAHAGSCAGPAVNFATRRSTVPLETSTLAGASTILNGDYNLVLAAVPAGQDTLLLAGANDLWKCSLAAGCAWRNTTNATTCMSAHVGEYQHALAWNAANPLEILAGNDSGLWRSGDGIGESGPACSADDGSHWQNLNGSLGSLAEVVSMSQVGSSPYTLMAGLGANGAAGVKGTAGPTAVWPQILGGEGGPVAVDPTNTNKWYVNNGAGVSIHLCSSSSLCTPSGFGELPVVNNADVANDGLTMADPAPFLVDPVDPSQLLIATCRLWRGPASPNGWTAANAVTPMLGAGASGSYCSGNPLIRSLTSVAIAGGGEVVYAGTYGRYTGGANLAGHVLKATMNASGTWSGWNDLTVNPVTNKPFRLNSYSFDISGITIDPHDATGNTVYVTIEGIAVNRLELLYRSTDGGGHWTDLTSNLPAAAANALVVDPVDANTVYVAIDAGVYATGQVSTCGNSGVSCWFAFGSRLPESPVTALSAAPATASPSVLVAGTYGRGVWQIPLLTAGVQMTTAVASPTSLTFAAQGQGTTSDPQTITLTNTGAIALQPTTIAVTGDFAETDKCAGAAVDLGAGCAIQVTFSPTRTGTRTGTLTILGNISTGNITIGLTGNGVPAPQITIQPASINFGSVATGTTSDPQQVTVENAGSVPVSITSLSVSGSFALGNNGCGAVTLAPNADCSLTVRFTPSTTGPATGTLTLVDSAGTQTVQLSGTGTAPPADTLSPASLTFPGTILGVNSAAQTVSLTNGGGNPLTSIAVSVSGPFQQNNNCTANLAAGASCSISVTYLPTAAGTQTGALTVADILKTQTVSLAGTGLLPPVFSVSPTSLGFGTQPVNAASAPLTLTVGNSGGAPMSNVGFQITGPSASDFATGTTNCGAALAVGASCTAQVTFTPSAAGAMQATLTVTSSTAGVKPVTVSLSGTGQSTGGLSATPAQLSFAATAVGQTSAAQTVTITNGSQTAATGLALATSGPFGLTQNQCGATLAAGGSCTSGVVFTPQQTGNLAGKLTVTSASLATPATVALGGIGGLNGALQMQPSQVSFPTTGVGTTSSAIAVTLTNTGSVSLDSFALTTTSGFRASSTTCGSSLAAGAACTANVVFTPAAAGAATGTLSIASAGLGADATVALSGTGFDFTPASSGSMTQTVASGQTASYTLSVTPGGGSDGTFTFQCNGVPQYAACIFNPSTLSVLANASGSESVRITTSQATAALESRPIGLRLPLSLACGLVLLPFALRRRRALLPILLLALALCGVTACAGSGGGGGGTPPPPTTHNVAAGTYSIPLVVMSNGVQHTVALTLVVD